MHSAPGREKPAANLPCCKELRAVMIYAVKGVAAVARQLVGEQDYAASVLVAPSLVVLRAAFRGPGPPPSLSFAEAILQRSILAHAPPQEPTRL
jgi:hypothetical protein